VLLEVKGAWVAGEWPCEVRDGPRGSGARRGWSRESGEDFGRRKAKELTAGPAGQRDGEGDARELSGDGPCALRGQARAGGRRAGPRCAGPGERCCRAAWGGSKPGRERAEREAGWAQEKKRALKRGRTGPWVGLPLGFSYWVSIFLFFSIFYF